MQSMYQWAMANLPTIVVLLGVVIPAMLFLWIEANGVKCTRRHY